MFYKTHSEELGGKEVLEVGGLTFGVTRIGIADAREGIPKLMNQVAQGEVFVIQNAKNPAAPAALLLSAAELATAMLTPKPRRTLFELIESLPLRIPGEAIPQADMPDDFAPDLTLPTKVHGAA